MGYARKIQGLCFLRYINCGAVVLINLVPGMETMTTYCGLHVSTGVRKYRVCVFLGTLIVAAYMYPRGYSSPLTELTFASGQYD